MSTKLAVATLQSIQDDMANMKIEATPQIIKQLTDAICKIAEVLAADIESRNPRRRLADTPIAEQ